MLAGLAVLPPGFYIDEAYPAYNAYSLLLTGRDEYAKFMPWLFRFYGSFNPPVSIYLAVLPIKLLGLSVFSARLTSALMGMLAVPVVYILLRRLKFSRPAWLAMVFLVTPWLIFYTRIGFEIVPAFTLWLLGLTMLYSSLTRRHFTLPAIFVLALSTYTAYTERFIVPLFLVVFIFLFRRNYPSDLIKKSVLLFILIQIPHLCLATTPAFFPKTHELPATLSLREFMAQYATYFSPQSLFYLPDPDAQRSLPELSVYYSWQFIPYLVGWYLLVRHRSSSRSKFIWSLALLTPVPAALTHDPFATHRSFPHLLPTFLIISLGLSWFLTKWPKISTLILGLLLAVSVIFLWRSYVVLLPAQRSLTWGYGQAQLAEYIKDHPDGQYVIDSSRTHPMYINMAFYLRLPPTDLQQSTDPDIKINYYRSLSFNPQRTFSRINFRPINWQRDVNLDQILVGDALAISAQQVREHYLKPEFKISNRQGDLIFQGFSTRPELKCPLCP